MLVKNWPVAVATLVVFCGVPSPCAAGLITKAEIQLGNPTFSNNNKLVRYTVGLDFTTADPSYGLSYFALDLSASNLGHTLSPTDYSAFSFALGSSLDP